MVHPSPPPHNEFEENFVRNIKTLRRFNGWSQAELSRQLKALGHTYHGVVLMRLENNDRYIKLRDVVAFAEVFNVSFDDMLKKQFNISGTFE